MTKKIFTTTVVATGLLGGVVFASDVVSSTYKNGDVEVYSNSSEVLRDFKNTRVLLDKKSKECTSLDIMLNDANEHIVSNYLSNGVFKPNKNEVNLLKQKLQSKKQDMVISCVREFEKLKESYLNSYESQKSKYQELLLKESYILLDNVYSTVIAKYSFREKE